MSLPDFGPQTPSSELLHFTNRESEKAAFRQHLTAPEGATLPVLSFYGVGGTGKTWLRKHLIEQMSVWAPKVRHAVVDFDSRQSNGALYIADPSNAWLEIRRQWERPCPFFDLACSLYQLKAQGVAIPQLTESETSKLEVAESLLEILLDEVNKIPGASFIKFGAKRGVEWLAKLEKEHKPDYKKLQALSAEDIYSQLLSRLIHDIGNAPKEADGQCQLVIFLDTFEELVDIDKGDQQPHRDKWIRELAKNSASVLVVICGHNQLAWEQNDDYWAQSERLEQHLVGGLAENDARAYLQNCGIMDDDLQTVVLEDCSSAPNSGYHPWTLGLCADTLYEEKQRRGSYPDAHEFGLGAGQQREVVARFLRSQDDGRRMWLEKLAVTLRFDREAALVAYSATPDVHAEAAWNRLGEFSFVSPAETPGFFVLHSHMRHLILQLLSDEKKRNTHEFWHEHWSERSKTEADQYAELSWFHEWHLEKEAAAKRWWHLGERLGAEFRTADQLRVALWPMPLKFETADVAPEARAFMMWRMAEKIWLCNTGNRSENLRIAMKSCDFALRMLRKDKFPDHWARSMNIKGEILKSWPDGDHNANLQKAIEHFDSSLNVLKPDTEEWARTQNIKGQALACLSIGDLTQHLRSATECHNLALRVFRQETFPHLWAHTQVSLGRMVSFLSEC